MKRYRLLTQDGYPNTLEVGKVYDADFSVQSVGIWMDVAFLAKWYPKDWALVSEYEERVEVIEKRLEELEKKMSELLNKL